MNTINPITSPAIAPLTSAPGAGKTENGGGSFADMLSGLVNDVNGLQAKAGELRTDLIAGESPDLHQIMIASEKAGVAMELLIEVRNKIVEAYDQLLRMPV